MFFQKKNITSFETIYLRISGMRYMQEFEVVNKDGSCEMLFYENGYSNEERFPQERIRCSEEEILQLLNTCKIFRWNGFFGKHPRNVRDGEMFLFTAVVNDGEKIRAEGSENFPKHYSELKNGLWELLNREETE